eukprot:TRINITY_DN9971_c8_g1_i1.p2 TRINITY_DN9971_c8_g1~~TRINITY_DN9971_c8_g1_i1.p2  ORF type:complete len:115 (-),score=62.07 TRINITY_DN9971_c8_g1_i1:42-386(-)
MGATETKEVKVEEQPETKEVEEEKEVEEKDIADEDIVDEVVDEALDEEKEQVDDEEAEGLELEGKGVVATDVNPAVSDEMEKLTALQKAEHDINRQIREKQEEIQQYLASPQRE